MRDSNPWCRVRLGRPTVAAETRQSRMAFLSVHSFEAQAARTARDQHEPGDGSTRVAREPHEVADGRERVTGERLDDGVCVSQPSDHEGGAMFGDGPFGIELIAGVHARKRTQLPGRRIERFDTLERAGLLLAGEAAEDLRATR